MSDQRRDVSFAEVFGFMWTCWRRLPLRQVDRILLFDCHRVAEQGSHDRLLDRDGRLYRRLFNFQALDFYQDATDAQAQRSFRTG